MDQGADGRPNLSERAYRTLREMAANYSFRPGERLNEVKLAQSLSLSRTPLREALHRLASEGLIVPTGGHGFLARPLDARQVHELYEARLALETAIVSLACARVTPDWRVSVGAYLDRSVRAHETAPTEELVRLDEGFHELLAEASGNEELVRMLRNINARIRFFRWVDMRGRRDGTQAEHRALADAVCAGDEARAAEITRAHIARRLDQIMRVVGEGYALLSSGDGPKPEAAMETNREGKATG